MIISGWKNVIWRKITGPVIAHGFIWRLQRHSWYRGNRPSYCPMPSLDNGFASSTALWNVDHNVDNSIYFSFSFTYRYSLILYVRSFSSCRKSVGYLGVLVL